MPRGLGWPLLIARVADEVSWLSIYAFWGQMGSAVSGAGYDAYTGMQFTLVFIFGAQQALYTMVPQATGAGNTAQVGALLQLVLFWMTVVLGVPTALAALQASERGALRSALVGVLAETIPGAAQSAITVLAVVSICWFCPSGAVAPLNDGQYSQRNTVPTSERMSLTLHC